MIPMHKAFLAVLWSGCALLFSQAAHAQEPQTRISVEASSSGKPISPDLIGIFFEDISYAADGGLYAELVQNRSFEYSVLDRMDWNPMTAWEEVSQDGARGSLKVADAVPVHPNNPRYLVLETSQPGGGFGLANGGFDGITVASGERYYLSLFGRQLFTGGRWGGSGRLEGPARIVVRLETKEGQKLAEAELNITGRDWQRYEASLTAAKSEVAARLVLLCQTRGAIALDEVSLFPENTFKQRRNGLRADLAQTIADLKPKFMRFPGGCLVHGYGLGNLYRWQDTVGPIEQRRGQPNIWGYHQSVGLGYYEYFQFCQDIGALPLPVVAAGVCCQNADYQGGTGQRGLPLDDMPAYIQEIFDLIEWANGPASSKWGAVRAAAGHPEPFHLKYLGVGNEDHITPVFRERFKLIFEALKEKHPEITVVGTVGPAPDGEDYEQGWRIANELHVPIVDEHYYRPPQWFWNNLERYDRYDRNASKVYVGEYAAHDDGRRSTLRSALAEAAYLTSLERNADVVPFASYAPLLAKRGHTDWSPNAIYFSNTQVVRTINYHVQKMFSLNGGDTYLPSTVIQPAAEDVQRTGQGILLATWNTQAEFDDVRIERNGAEVVKETFAEGAKLWRADSGSWSAVGGVYRQSGADEPSISHLIPSTGGNSYSLSLRARKTGGMEGFLVGFRAQDNEHYFWWNLGGWGNTRDVVEKASGGGKTIVGEDKSISIEQGRWYDIRVEVAGPRIRCYLNGELRQDFTDAGFVPVPDLAFSSVRDSRTGDLILKLVNGAGKVRPVRIELKGASPMRGDASVTVLAAANAMAVNDFGSPETVTPRTSTLKVAPAFDYDAPDNSLTIIRIPKR